MAKRKQQNQQQNEELPRKNQLPPWGCFIFGVLPIAILMGLGMGYCARETPDEAREKSERQYAEEKGIPYIKHTPSGDGSTSPQKFVDDNLNGIQKGYSAKIVDGWICYYVPTGLGDPHVDARAIYDLAMNSGVSSKAIKGIYIYSNRALTDTTYKASDWEQAYDSWDE